MSQDIEGGSTRLNAACVFRVFFGGSREGLVYSYHIMQVLHISGVIYLVSRDYRRIGLITLLSLSLQGDLIR